MAKKGILGDKQKKKYNKIKSNKGKDAAKEYRQKIRDRKNADGPGGSTPGSEHPGSVPGGDNKPGNKPTREGTTTPPGGTPPRSGEATQPEGDPYTGYTHGMPGQGSWTDIGRKGGGPESTKPGHIARGAGKVGGYGEDLGKSIAPELFEYRALGRANDPYRQGVDANLNAMTEFRQGAGETSAELQDILARRQAGLEGFTTPEEEALKQEAAAGIDANLMSGMRAAKAMGLSGNLRGGMAAEKFAPAMRAAIQGQTALSGDIFRQQIAERGKRLNEYQGAVQQRDADLYNRQAGALGLEQQGFQSQQAANQDLQRFNLGQRAREIAGRTAARGTGMDLYLGERDYRTGRRDLKDLVAREESQFNQLLGMLA